MTLAFLENNLTDFNRIKVSSSRFKPLISAIKKITGRSHGRIVSPRRGGSEKRHNRIVDYLRIIFPNRKGLVIRHDHNPRTQMLDSLISYPSGVILYILKAQHLQVGDFISNLSISSLYKPKSPGDAAPLSKFGSGILVHNIGLYPNTIGQLTRSAGCSTILVRKETDHVLLKLKSGELRYVNASVTGSLGAVGGETHFLRDYKKAGLMRHLGNRPRTRPSAMNPVDHPMGGRTRGGFQPCNAKGVIMTHRSTKKKYHPAILFTKRQLKFKRF